MPDPYSQTTWTVKPGHEEEFVQRWREFADWSAVQGLRSSAKLFRDVERPCTFLSFGPWESFEAQQAWKDDPDFKERIMRVRQHVEDFTPSVFELVTAVE